MTLTCECEPAYTGAHIIDILDKRNVLLAAVPTIIFILDKRNICNYFQEHISLIFAAYVHL